MKKTTATLRYVLSVHVLALIILSIFRIVLCITNIGQTATIDNRTELLLQAILKGVQFDNIIVSYITALPLIVLSVAALFNKIPSILIKIFNTYYVLLYFLVFALSAADIPYFGYYFSHMGASIFNWLGFGGTTLGMIIQESSYYIYFAIFIILFIVFCFGISYFTKKLMKTSTTNLKKKDYGLYIPIILIIWGLCFFGIRGTLERYPLRISNAYFCNNSFFNQLGINPTFYLIKSYSAFSKKCNSLDAIISEQDAILFVNEELAIDNADKSFNPISRKVEADGEAKNANVVIILMESLSSNYLDFEHKGKKLMPYINELTKRSYYFENFYSAGIHTNNGIAATLYGYPPQFDKTMMGIDIDSYTGLPITLRDQGYQTMFFLTSNPQYDNMNSFLLENGFDRIYSQYDYPKDKVVNNFGVQDDYLFEYGIKRINEASKLKKPFLATFMTVSNHPPLVVPERFKNSADNDFDRILAFVDNSLEEFMKEAAKEDWYNNTIFIILGDHGRVLGKQPYDMALSYNHIPLIIYSPLFNDMPKQFEQFGGQIDVFPTVMGLLNRSYTNNTLGIDLFKTRRRYAFFVSDTHLGCINDRFFYIYNPQNKNDGLYEYRNEEASNVKSEYTAVADSMKTYSISMMITADYIVKNKLTTSDRGK